MSRPLRIIEPGLWHHVMNRGASGTHIYRDDHDRLAFLDLVEDCALRWRVRTAAVCLMDNHYHALVYDEQGMLSRAMRHLDGVYTQRFNRRYDRDGSLMRGRFQDRLVESEGYVLEVVRYLHTNPVRAGLAKRAADYRWSSHGAYLTGNTPDWLRTSDVWDLFGDGSPEDRLRFDEYVHQRIPRETLRTLGARRWSPILGSPEFVSSWRQRLRQNSPSVTPEIPAARRLKSWTLTEVVDAARAEFQLEGDDLLRGRRGQPNPARMACLLVCRDHTASTLKEIAEVFGVGATTVSSLVFRVRERLGSDTELAVAHDKLLGRLEDIAAEISRRDPTGIRKFIDRIS
jgi:putative transposase